MKHVLLVMELMVKGLKYVAPNILAYDDALIHAVLLDGKKAEIGAMPSFRGRLSNTQRKSTGCLY